MRFADLFAGLGGFHLALARLGHTCVFACETDQTLRQLYALNYGIEAVGDIRKVPDGDVPPHDILCAGFPCQPFSKAGSQSGLDDPDQGTLFFEIMRLIRSHRPAYLILENVPNFEKHNNGRTWVGIEQLLRDQGYHITQKKLSPHYYGIPQIRERIYIVGSLTSLASFAWPRPLATETSIYSILDTHPADARIIPERAACCLAVWQDFLDALPRDQKVPHPLWSMEFGATYPYEDTTPHCLPVSELRKYRGSHGQPLDVGDREELLSLLPSHARRQQARFPDWKVKFIRLNRDFYHKNRGWIDKWKPKIMVFPSSFQKLEWNCQGEPRTISRYVIQIRASGVRVKRPTTAPSLVAMTATQVPIIPWEGRYMTPNECKRLQSMQDLKNLPAGATKAYQALGNAVNVEVARLVAQALIQSSNAAALKLPPVDNAVADLTLTDCNSVRSQSIQEMPCLSCTRE